MAMILEQRLGRTVQIFLKDGSGFHFRPMEYNQLDRIFTGFDQEHAVKTIREVDIDAVIYFKN